LLAKQFTKFQTITVLQHQIQVLQNYDNLVKHQNPLAQQHSITSHQTDTLSNTAVGNSTLTTTQSFHKNRAMKIAFQQKTAFVMPTQNHFPEAIILLPVLEVTSFHTILHPKFVIICLNTNYMSLSSKCLSLNNTKPLSHIIPLRPLFFLLSMTDQVSYPDKDTGHIYIPSQSLLSLTTARSKSHQ